MLQAFMMMVLLWQQSAMWSSSFWMPPLLESPSIAAAVRSFQQPAALPTLPFSWWDDAWVHLVDGNVCLCNECLRNHGAVHDQKMQCCLFLDRVHNLVGFFSLCMTMTSAELYASLLVLVTVTHFQGHRRVWKNELSLFLKWVRWAFIFIAVVSGKLNNHQCYFTHQ